MCSAAGKTPASALNALRVPEGKGSAPTLTLTLEYGPYMN
jgi:hypothetical protein